MDKIKVFDNFLNENDLNILVDYVNKQNFNYGHKSGVKETIIVDFFSNYIHNEFINNIIHKIENITDKKFILHRNYMHIQTFGLDGCYHVDTYEKDCYTICIYVTNKTNQDIDNMNGDFYIKIPNSKLIFSFQPYMNRMLFFPSNYLHKGMAYNRFYNNERLCITWKLKEII